MIAGHFGFAAAVKSRAQATPLWALMLATVWLDIIFVPLFVAHVETMTAVPGQAGRYGGNIIFADYTHSLLGALLLSLVLGLLAAWMWDRTSGLIVGAVAFSHWCLDLLTHRGDMPLLPVPVDHLPRLGLGLWRWPAASAGLELVLVVAGALLYWRAASAVARAAGRGRRVATLAGVLSLGFGLLVLALDVTALLP